MGASAGVEDMSRPALLVVDGVSQGTFWACFTGEIPPEGGGKGGSPLWAALPGRSDAWLGAEVPLKRGDVVASGDWPGLIPDSCAFE